MPLKRKARSYLWTVRRNLYPSCNLGCEPAVSAPKKTPAEVFDTYLGMLYPTADYKVYAYISNTRIKFMLVLDDTQKDEKMRMVMSAVEPSCDAAFANGNMSFVSVSPCRSLRGFMQPMLMLSQTPFTQQAW